MIPLASGFLEFLRSMDLRVFQEREVGLDIYLSGWGIAPAALLVASATVFLLAIFQAIPRLRHSIPILVSLGVLAASIGLLGTYVQYRALEPGRPPPRILTDGRGGNPDSKPGQPAALLSLPLLLGGLTLACDLGGVCFIALFSSKPKK
jgi:hypothetical protein